jgi:hypothetical protein
MQLSTDLLDEAADDVRAYRGATIGSLTHGQLLDAQRAAASARRAAEVILAALAAEIAERSVAGGLAKAEGFSSPQRLIASATGSSLADAHRLVEAGALLAQSEPPAPGDNAEAPGDIADAPADDAALPGEAGAPNLAQSLRTGLVSVDAAALIGNTVTRIHAAAQAGLADLDSVDNLERKLTALARTLTLAELRKACERAEANASPAAWELRERRQHQARCVTVGSDSEGMVVVTARLDPPSAAPVVAWLDAQVRDAFQRRRDAQGARVPAPADNRTAGQIRADALVALARHGLACEDPTSGVKTTVIVRMSLEQLREANGMGEADGIGECDTLAAPLSASAARRMAVDAEVIPEVLGAESEVLDVGRSRRLFTRAQRLALVERDGGCAWCHAPPSFCDAHHIRWWTRDSGSTNLGNGVLLCVSCHHRLHDAGWEVVVNAGKVYFVPLAGVDPNRTPRLGGRARLDVGTPDRAELEPVAA